MHAAFDGRPAALAYQDAFRRMGSLRRYGFDQQSLLRAEAGVILKTWAGRTKVARLDQAIARARTRAAVGAGVSRVGNVTFGLSVNTGRRGGEPGLMWFRYPSGKFGLAGTISDRGAIKYSWIHYRRQHWEEIKGRAEAYRSFLAIEMKHARASVGLNRQSIIQIADELGIDLSRVKGGGSLSASGIAKARAAIASNGRAYKNGTGRQGGDEVRCYVEMINRLPYGVKSGMDRTLAGILAGRAKYIHTSYKKGAFDAIARATHAFPNLFNLSQLN